jgi:hypothetical protein
MTGEVRDQLGILCVELSRWDQLDSLIRDGGAAAELDELLGAVSGAKLQTERALVLLAAIAEACRRSGLDWPPGGRFGPLPSGLSTPPTVDGWVCPRGYCDRVVLAAETSHSPVCQAGRTPMKPYRLAP